MGRAEDKTPQNRIRSASLSLGRAFRVSLLLKGADAALEVVGGALVLVTPPAVINHLVVALTQRELSEDPRDFVAVHLRDAVAHFGSTRLFAAAYLLSHGLGKIVLVVQIFRGRLWAYPAMIVLLLLFIAYQTLRLSTAFTTGMLALTIFDAVIVWLTWREYGRRRSALVHPDTQRPALR